MSDAIPILRFLTAAHERGERTALVTITEVLGSSSRAPGTHMAVSESGASIGSLSGGCVEAAVVAEALRLIHEGRSELIRFGRGSRFIDIRLPCGGGIDLMILPDLALSVVGTALGRLEARQPVCLSLSLENGIAFGDQTIPGWKDGRFFVHHRPGLRLVVVGHGEEVTALHRLAMAHGCEVAVLTPDQRIVNAVQYVEGQAHLLKTPAPSPHLVADRDSAVVFLFHDHDWEAALLTQALEQEAFFVGAMGSRATHRQRRLMLEAQGLGAASIDRVVGPIGLLPSTRDPATLALSILGQVVERHRIALQAGSDTSTQLKAA